jgi:hypothetical protein
MRGLRRGRLVELRPTRKVVVLGLDERELDDLVWCALTYNVNRLFWIDGYVLCVEAYEDSFRYEIEKGVFPINHICYARLPEYRRVYEVERGMQVPIVNVSGMRVYREIASVIRGEKSNRQ